MNDASAPTPKNGNDRAVELFHYEDHELRTVVIDGEPWFVAADVCAVLDIADPKSSLRLLDDDERGVHSVHTPGGHQLVNVISEPGLYSLILRSRKPEAKAFKRWVTHEVLPAIRRTGTYTVAQPGGELEMLRTVIDQMIVTRDLANRAGAAAVEAGQEAALANARLDAIEGRHDWFSALGYAKVHGLRCDTSYLARVGKLAATIGRSRGITPARVQHSHFGRVNEFPAQMWCEAFGQLDGGQS